MTWKRVEQEFVSMKEVLCQMRVVTIWKPNIFVTIKGGLKSLDSSLDVMQTMQCLWHMSIQRVNRHTEAKETGPFSPTYSIPPRNKWLVVYHQLGRRRADTDRQNPGWTIVIGRTRKAKANQQPLQDQVEGPSRRKGKGASYIYIYLVNRFRNYLWKSLLVKEKVAPDWNIGVHI